MTEPSPPSPPPWGRLAVTLGLLGVTVALPQLPIGLPWVDAWTAHDQATSVAASGVFALGITPLVSAMGLVELVAVAVPRWRPLRHGGPAGRATLGRAALVVAAVLCALQGFGVAQLLEPLGALTRLGLPSMLMVMVSLATGTFLLMILAQLASARGLVSGVAVVLLGGVLADRGKAAEIAYMMGEVDARAVAVRAAGALATIAVTWLILRAPRERTGLATLPAPASGIGVLSLAGVTVATVETLRRLAGVAPPIVASETMVHGAGLILVAGLGVGFTWLFNAPSRVAGLAARVREGRDGIGARDLEAEVRGGMREAALRSVAFLVALFAIGRLTGDSSSAADVSFLAMGTALALDAAAEWRARRARPDLVPVWPEHRPYALAAVRAALAEAGITVHARGENLRRLLQFAGPYVPIDLMVPRADAPRAAVLLDGLLRFRAEDAPGHEPATLGEPRPWTRLQGGLLAGAVALGSGALLLTAPRVAEHPPHAPARPDALLILAVDDDHDLFDPPPANLPEGVSILAENAPLGPEGAAMRHYARLIPAKGEGQEQGRARLLRWADAVALPRSLTVRAEAVLEYDDATDTTAPIGWRTMLVQGAPVIDGADVKDAVAREAPRTRGGHGPASGEGATVHIELAPASAERFRAFTASHVKRRLAIVVDGVVESAPVILSAIDGGRLTITMGAASPEDQLAAARALEARLLGRP